MDNYIGEIRLFPYNHIPANWMACNGQTLNLQQYQALGALIVNTYGGNFPQNFNLPNLNGKVIVGVGQNATSQTIYNMGNTGGQESVTLTAANLPPHMHTAFASETYDTTSPSTNFLANPNTPTLSGQSTKNINPVNAYNQSGTLTGLHPATVTSTGSTAPVTHENRMPYLPMVYCIATQGVWPPKP